MTRCDVPRLRRAAGTALDAVDPARLRPFLLRRQPEAALLLVYRARNEVTVLRLAREAARGGAAVLLWALDEVAPELAPWTRGTGPGSRFHLLNQLAEAAPAGRWLLVSDDDVRFIRGGLLRFLKVALHYGYDVSQPAHTRNSKVHHMIARRHRWAVARDTTWVEIGPVFALSPAARHRLLPFPVEGMGWGVELLWHDAWKEGLKLGVIDATPVEHLVPIGKGYDAAGERERVLGLLQDRGLSSMGDVQHTLRRHRC